MCLFVQYLGLSGTTHRAEDVSDNRRASATLRRHSNTICVATKCCPAACRVADASGEAAGDDSRVTCLIG
jgi:hypothetical protein